MVRPLITSVVNTMLRSIQSGSRHFGKPTKILLLARQTTF